MIECMYIGIVQVLLYGKSVIELMGEVVVYYFLVVGDFIIGFVFVEIGWQFVCFIVGVVIWYYGVFVWQLVVVVCIWVILEVVQEGEVGFIVWMLVKGGCYCVVS